MKRKGFTLIELLVVIAVLAILATVSIVGYSSFIGKAKSSNAKAAISQFRDYIYAELANGESKSYNVDGAGNLSFTLKGNTVSCTAQIGNEKNIDGFFETYEDLSSMLKNGDLTIVIEGDTTTVTKIIYTTDGETSAWNLNDNTIE